MTNPDYATELDAIAASLPLVSKRLLEAQRQRAQRLGSASALVRLKGLEQFYAYLIAERAAYRENPDLQPLTFLIDRLLADFETGLEAILSGYPGVCADAMRDVMETEALLLDFANSWDNAREWLQGDDRTRRRRYTPVGYMEIFEHSRRVLDALDRLRLARSSDNSAPRLSPAMDDYFSAGQLTKTNEALVVGVMKAIQEKSGPSE